MEHTGCLSRKRPPLARIIFWVFIGIVAALFFSALFAVAVTYLWNWLMTDIFGLKSITYLQAFGLVLLTRLLVGGWHRSHRNGHPHFYRRISKKDRDLLWELHDNKEDLKEFWEQEGRETFKNYMEEKKNKTD